MARDADIAAKMYDAILVDDDGNPVVGTVGLAQEAQAQEPEPRGSTRSHEAQWDADHMRQFIRRYVAGMPPGEVVSRDEIMETGGWAEGRPVPKGTKSLAGARMLVSYNLTLAGLHQISRRSAEGSSAKNAVFEKPRVQVR
jgi:hypothetical protein